MLPVYCEHFALTRAPFNVTPDPSFLYLSAGHKEALAQLIYGIRMRRGLIVLTGEVGTGKTTLIQSLLEEIHDSHTRCALLLGLADSPKDLLSSLCGEFGLVSSAENHREIADYLTLLQRFSFDAYRNGENTVVIIDEAQNLPVAAMEPLRFVSNFETRQDKLLQIVLVGQPELGERLNDPELRQLKQRVALRHHLSSLNFPECREYIAKRLETSGGAVTLFSDDALEAVHTYSDGIPRLINILCDNALLSACFSQKPSVDRPVIDHVARVLQLTRRRVRKRKNLTTKTDGMPDREATAGPTEMTRRAAAERPPFVHSSVAANSDANDAVQLSEDTAQVEERADESTETLPALVPDQIFQSMISALTEATGPMAAIILREHLVAMGESRNTFPIGRLEQLLDQIGSEIANDQLRERFRRRMCEEIYTFKKASPNHKARPS